MKAFTHSGTFHADDVFSAALLKIIYPSITIERGFTVPQDFDGIVFDIGGGKFDHHQHNAEYRVDSFGNRGTKYAAFGLLWREYGHELMEKPYAERFDREFIQPIDECDNFGGGNQINRVISKFNPSWSSSKESDDAFEEAVIFAKRILENEIAYVSGKDEIKKIIDRATWVDNDIVVLEKYVPSNSILINTKAKFTIYPSLRGGYQAKVIPVSEAEPNTPKVKFPESWTNFRGAELGKISGVDTLSFCHNGRFLIACDTKEDCIKACRIAKKSDSIKKIFSAVSGPILIAQR